MQTEQPQEQDNVVSAPWSQAQVEHLNDRQDRDELHPYTCGQCGGSLEAFSSGWYCAEQCGYHQNWCHATDLVT